MAKRQAPAVLGDDALRHHFVVGVREEWVRRELRWLMMASADKPFFVVREESLCLMCDEEDRIVQMRSVEGNATPALSVPSVCASVVDSGADVLCVDKVMLGDGGLSCGGVGGVGLYASRACRLRRDGWTIGRVSL